MNRERLAHFQERLSSSQGEIQRSLRTAAQGRHDEGAEPDITDRASRSYEKELSFLTAAQHQERLKEVQQALRRFGTGEYGRCQRCGVEINPKRLEAVPWTQYCIACQQNLERASAHAEAKHK